MILHIKVVTRDRASAYAKVISEELPDAMQVADRFHLHQNLLSEGCSYREIAKRMGIGRNAIAKYREGDPKELSLYKL